MALQRTRRPRYRSGRSLRSHRLAAERPTVRHLVSSRMCVEFAPSSWSGCDGNHRGQEKLMPNMALQRTHRPRVPKSQSGRGDGVSVQELSGTGRSLRSLGAPLNARPLGTSKHVLERTGGSR